MRHSYVNAAVAAILAAQVHFEYSKMGSGNESLKVCLQVCPNRSRGRVCVESSQSTTVQP